MWQSESSFLGLETIMPEAEKVTMSAQYPMQEIEQSDKTAAATSDEQRRVAYARRSI